MKSKITYIFVLIVFSAGLFSLTFYLRPTAQISQKCPEDYTEDDIGTSEYRNVMINWTSDFFKEHPKATMSDWSKAKTQLWSDNNCIVAIQRSKMSGEVAELKPWELVDYEIQNSISNATETPLYISEYGFSFNYQDSMRVTTDPDNTDDNFRIFVIVNSDEATEDKPMSAVVISGARNNPPITPLEWLKGSNSGADMSKGYDTLNMDGQEAISMEEGSWVVINTPDNKYRLSIATLPSQKPSQELIDAMGDVVDSIVFRK